VLGSSGATAGDQDGTVPGGGYTPYALREGLYQRGWNDYFKLLQRFWQPYLDGHVSFDEPSPHGFFAVVFRDFTAIKIRR